MTSNAGVYTIIYTFGHDIGVHIVNLLRLMQCIDVKNVGKIIKKNVKKRKKPLQKLKNFKKR